VLIPSNWRAITEGLLLRMSKALRMFYHFSLLSPSAQKIIPNSRGGCWGLRRFGSWPVTVLYMKS